MLHCLFGSGDSSGRLITHLDTRFLAPCLDSVTHDKGSLRRCVHGNLTGRSLDEITSGSHREDGCFPDILCGFEHTGFENHFEVLVPANRLQFAYLVEALLIVALEELTHAQHNIYLRSSGFDSHSRFRHFDLHEGLGSRKTAADARDIELGVFERAAHIFRHCGINADSRYIRNTRKVFLEIIDRIRHLLYLGNRVIGGEGGIVNLVETLFPDLHVIVLVEVFCFDFCYLSLDLLIGKRAGVLRK